MNPNEFSSINESKSLLINKNLPLNQTAFQSTPPQIYNFFSIFKGPKEENINYYQESCRLYIANVILTTQVYFLF